MKYLETKHEQNSAKITTLIIVILVLLMFVVGHDYVDPPEEYGVAVNFGTTDFGSGTVQPKAPIKSEPNEKITEPVIEESQPETTEAEETTPVEETSKAEDVITEESAESIAIKKQKAAEAKAISEAKAEAKRVEDAKKAAAEKKRQEEAEKKKALDALIGGVTKSEGAETGGEGPDNKAGDKGQLDGDPYAPYNGNPGSGAGGMGYGLNGRGKPDFKFYDGCENEYGLIVVDIVVNQNGNVIEATPGAKGSSNVTTCLKEVARKIAKSYKWPADANAPTRQFGKVSINFTPSN